MKLHYNKSGSFIKISIVYSNWQQLSMVLGKDLHMLPDLLIGDTAD